ncbi:MAG: FadR/GntR family transcriptional regulator [Gammaproteobacteria bacterium]|nr:FadR/GntR family transcriptional regulator [Gammaproteobacteria bacterium]
MSGNGALTQLREFISNQDYPLNSRLPPERRLCEMLGVSRSALRKALSALEAEGQVWRHVGRGTFIGSRPPQSVLSAASLIRATSPAEVMQARLLIEPELARLAAINASARDIEEMRRCIRRTRSAGDWRVYETWDNRLHREIAEATHNTLLLSLFDTLNTVRRAVAWGRARTTERPRASHHSFAEHDDIVEAIAARDTEAAADAMCRHLDSVRSRLLDGVKSSI